MRVPDEESAGVTISRVNTVVMARATPGYDGIHD